MQFRIAKNDFILCFRSTINLILFLFFIRNVDTASICTADTTISRWSKRITLFVEKRSVHINIHG